MSQKIFRRHCMKLRQFVSLQFCIKIMYNVINNNVTKNNSFVDPSFFQKIGRLKMLCAVLVCKFTCHTSASQQQLSGSGILNFVRFSWFFFHIMYVSTFTCMNKTKTYILYFNKYIIKKLKKTWFISC